MSLPDPVGTTTIEIEGLGTVKGNVYPGGIRQFCGIPYGYLKKRWTRSVLKTSWEDKGNFHDGTHLGATAPNPSEFRGDSSTVPVDHRFPVPKESEKECLVINLVLPPADQKPAGPYPILLFTHGGSFLFGGANRPVYDMVNLVTHSVNTNSPVIAVTFNYRVGLLGFLASKAIGEDLKKDGFEGNGNFGLTDQQLAISWVEKYITQLGGDKDNVTLYGESAGGMSVDHQIHAAKPANFQRAILMSGMIETIPTWTLERHEKMYRSLARAFSIDPDAPDALDKLRALDDLDVAEAAVKVAGVDNTTGCPCADGWFHASPPSWKSIGDQPSFLKGYMVGDVFVEGIVMRGNVDDTDYNDIHGILAKWIGAENATIVLTDYDITPETPATDMHKRFEDIAGDVLFKTPNWLYTHRSTIPKTYGYHFDQSCQLEGNPLNGEAYHAHELLYVFLNLQNKMTQPQITLAKKMATSFIDFAYGRDPWEPFSVGHKWMVFGDVSGVSDVAVAKSEEEDEPIRRYTRMQKHLDLLGVEGYGKLAFGLDDFGQKRHLLDTFE
ncbi:hypothetical protein KEM52_004686 [Ascosphaera acerosa]|nr:hypothetical protein KEM52_004686 [Ascosphaera acerosa]